MYHRLIEEMANIEKKYQWLDKAELKDSPEKWMSDKLAVVKQADIVLVENQRKEATVTDTAAQTNSNSRTRNMRSSRNTKG